MPNSLGMGIIAVVILAGAAMGLAKVVRFAKRTEQRPPTEE
jgi:hypothetical protein